MINLLGQDRISSSTTGELFQGQAISLTGALVQQKETYPAQKPLTG